MNKLGQRKRALVVGCALTTMALGVAVLFWQTRTEVSVRVGEQRVKVPIPEPGHVLVVGQVTEEGKPLEGVKVYSQRRELISITDAHGIYILPYGPAKKVELLAQFVKNSGFPVGRWYEIQRGVEPGEIARIDFDYKLGNATLEGIVSRGGEPVACEFQISAIPADGEEKEYLFPERVKTDDEGRFGIAHLPVGDYLLSMFVAHIEHRYVSNTDVSVTIHAGQLHWLDIELLGGVKVSGRLEGLKSDAEMRSAQETVSHPARTAVSAYHRAAQHIRIVRGKFTDGEIASLSRSMSGICQIENDRFSFNSVRPGLVSFVMGDRCVLTTEIPPEGIKDLVITIPDDWDYFKP